MHASESPHRQRRVGAILVLLAVAVALGAVVALAVHAARAASPQRGSAIYLSIGDGIQWGCCGPPSHSAGALFGRYLSARLSRPVAWVPPPTSPDYSVTASGFVGGNIVGLNNGDTTTPLQRVMAAIAAYRHQNRPVVAITLGIGGNDLVEVGKQCQSPPCTDLYYRVLNRMTPQLDEIYRAIIAAKDPSTPLMVLTYYNASDCGQAGADTSPTELGVRGWDAAIAAAVARTEAFVVDGYTPFRGRACQLINGLDLNDAGHAVMAGQYEQTYASLPSQYTEPFDLATSVNRWALGAVLIALVIFVIGLALVLRPRDTGA